MSYRNRPKKTGRLATIARRFDNENMMQTAAALAFTTLLALVPLVTLVVSIGSAVPFFDLLMKRFDSLIVGGLLPQSSAGVIVSYVAKFTEKARSLTIPGLLVLSLTAFLLLHTIEHAFNHLWQVKPRPLLQRLRLYTFVMIAWPFLLGGLAALMSYAVTLSLGFMQETGWVRPFAYKALSVLLLGLFFAFLYYAVPNAKVGKASAMLGGTFATIAFALMQRAFEWYLGSFAGFKSIYGALAAIPIFLVWLQLSWAVVLLGGLIAASFFRPQRR